MAPNPLHIFTPRRWFSRRKERGVQTSRYSRQETPVPGLYHYIPGKGNYLVVRDDDGTPLNPPVPVVFSSVLDRYLFQDDYAKRKLFGVYERVLSGSDSRPSRNSSSSNVSRAGSTKQPVKSLPGRKVSLSAYFFRLDDNTYVRAYDADGVFLDPSLDYRYKCIPSVSSDMPPFFRRVKLIVKPAQSSAVPVLGTVPEGGQVTLTIPSSPRKSWDVEGTVYSEASGMESFSRMSRASSLPDMTGAAIGVPPTIAGAVQQKPSFTVERTEPKSRGVRNDSAKDIRDNTVTFNAKKDSRTEQPSTTKAALTIAKTSSLNIVPSASSLHDGSTAVGVRATKINPPRPGPSPRVTTFNLGTHQSKGSSIASASGLATPGSTKSAKGTKTPLKKKGVMMMGELRRKLEALTTSKRSTLIPDQTGVSTSS